MSHADEHAAFDAPQSPTVQDDSGLCRIEGSKKVLGEGMEIQRFLPTRRLRMIGAWTFLDHIGPADVGSNDGVRVGPHPHTGLQTFTWMIEGELLHRDSLGTVQLIKPGQVNLMTAGRGISHSEESPAERSAGFHAAQLWIALPNDKRFIAPAFAHHPVLPRKTLANFDVVVIAGEAFGLRAPPVLYSELMAAELYSAKGGAVTLALEAAFEHGFLLLAGAASIDGAALTENEILYAGCGKTDVTVAADAGSRLLVIGGKPFGEQVLMWWNFIGRSKDELTTYVQQWNAGADFGVVEGYPGERLLAPVPPWAN